MIRSTSRPGTRLQSSNTTSTRQNGADIRDNNRARPVQGNPPSQFNAANRSCTLTFQPQIMPRFNRRARFDNEINMSHKNPGAKTAKRTQRNNRTLSKASQGGLNPTTLRENSPRTVQRHYNNTQALTRWWRDTRGLGYCDGLVRGHGKRLQMERNSG
jgi:hypothetical protein